MMFIFSNFQIGVKIEGPSTDSVLSTEVYPSDLSGCLFDVQFRVKHVAVYKISLTWGKEHLLGSPFKCIVQS